MGAVLGDLAAEAGGVGDADGVEVTSLRIAPFDSRKFFTFLACSSVAERLNSNGSLARAPRICSAVFFGNILWSAATKASGEVPSLSPVTLIANLLASALTAL
jgi:hypothetical protein